jgi:hypothetical protein
MRLFAAACLALCACVANLPQSPPPIVLPADHAFDNPQSLVIYGRAPGIHQENLHLIHAHVPDYNYPLRGTDSGWFVMEIEPGFYQVKPASWRIKYRKAGFNREGFAPTDRVEGRLEEEGGAIGASFLGNPGEILYLGTFTRRQEFVETRDEKEAADAWMARRYAGFRKEKTRLYLAK